MISPPSRSTQAEHHRFDISALAWHVLDQVDGVGKACAKLSDVIARGDDVSQQCRQIVMPDGETEGGHLSDGCMVQQEEVDHG